jgi:hypothetical protein
LESGGELAEGHAQIHRRHIDAGDINNTTLPGLGSTNDFHKILLLLKRE